MRNLITYGALLTACALLPLGAALRAQPAAPAVAQTQSQDGAALLARAREIYVGQGARDALPEFEKALALFRAAGDRRNEAVTLGLIGNCHKRLGDFPKALDHLARALSLKREIGDRVEEGKTLSHLGLLFWEQGAYPRAVEHFTRAITIGGSLGDRVLEASARNNLALVYDELGEYRRSLGEYERALTLYREAQAASASDPALTKTIERGVSDTVGNIGGTHLLLGDYAQALRYYQQSLAIDERLALKPALSQDWGNVALCQAGLGRGAEALLSLDRALALAREAGMKKEEADWLKAKGSVLAQSGRYAEALDHFRQALQTYEQAGLKRELVEALGDLGDLELRLGDAASAEREFRRAAEVSREIGHARGVTLNLLAVGDLEWRRKRYAEAEALYLDALKRAEEAQDRATAAAARIRLSSVYRDLRRYEEAAREARAAHEVARAVEARPLEAQALYAQAETARARGQAEAALTQYAAGEALVREMADPELGWRLAFGRGQASESLGRSEEALSAYQSAVRTIEQVRSGLREERYRAGYIEDKYQVYVALVQLLLKLNRIEEAFVFSEKLRARSYLDLLGRGRPVLGSESQRQAEAALRGRVRQLQRRLEEETAKPTPEQKRQALDLFSKELAEAERSYQNFLDDLSNTEPNLATTRALKVPTVAEVQRRLAARTALVMYVMAEDALHIFVVTAESLRARTVPVRAAELKVKVDLLRGVMLRHHTDEWRLPAASLYEILIGPVAKAGWLRGVERLYIVPHANLHYVPFAALRKEGAAGRFLVDEYELAYLPAAAALVFGEKPPRPSESVLAVAPSSTRLRYTQQESRGVAEFFPKRSALLLGARATESSFKRMAGDYDVIHLATHGYFNKLNPLLSGLAFERDAEDDGRLEAHEILGLRLKARLVTLSACDTALGGGYFADVPAGDDLVGLTRSFLFAGSPTVLASLWEVNDLSAVRLMQGFYGQLGRSDKAAALAAAQRERRRRGGRYAHPYFWAAFVLVGQMD